MHSKGENILPDNAVAAPEIPDEWCWVVYSSENRWMLSRRCDFFLTLLSSVPVHVMLTSSSTS